MLSVEYQIHAVYEDINYLQIIIQILEARRSLALWEEDVDAAHLLYLEILKREETVEKLYEKVECLYAQLLVEVL